MNIENSRTFNFDGAFRGLRNPYESWDKSDSYWEVVGQLDFSDPYSCFKYHLGEKDIELAQKMIRADLGGDGEPNSKFLRQIFVCCDITAPLYWWKEADTYKVATTANSTSTMHTIQRKEIDFDLFELDDVDFDLIVEQIEGEEDVTIRDIWKQDLRNCEILRAKHNEFTRLAKEATVADKKKYYSDLAKKYWKELIRKLPEAWLQKRTWTCDYSTLRNIYRWRHSHKLTEWHAVCDWIETLPYAKELILYKGGVE